MLTASAQKYRGKLYSWSIILAISTRVLFFLSTTPSCYISNRVFKRPILNKTSYELWNNRKPKISYLRVFGYKCFILNTKNNLGKFDSKADEGIFLGYSTSSKAYRIFNKRTLVVEESMQVVFYETNSLDPRKDVCSVNDNIGKPLETNTQEENASKPLEFEGPSKEDNYFER